MHKYALIGIFIKLFLGSANYFAAKAMNSTCGDSMYTPDSADMKKCLNGQTPFKKAFFVTFCNFFSLSFCILIFLLFRRKKLDPAPYTRRNFLLMMIPGTAEAIAFCLATSAQILMALSLSMIMKGAKVVFSALFTTILFRTKLAAFKWVAVGICVAGLALAGGSEYMNAKGDSATDIVIGLSMSLASEALFAFQVIFDERMMKKKGVDVTFVVGMEGVYGTLILIPVVLLAWLVIPGSQGDSYENLPDTLHRVSNSPVIIGLMTFYILDIFIVAMADATITKYLSGVHSSLVSVGRTMVVWFLELVLYYAAPLSISEQYGQKFGQYSPLKIVGFAIVVAAIFMYDATLRLPWLDYSSVSQKPGAIPNKSSDATQSTASDQELEVKDMAMEKEPTSDELPLAQ